MTLPLNTHITLDQVNKLFASSNFKITSYKNSNVCYHQEAYLTNFDLAVKWVKVNLGYYLRWAIVLAVTPCLVETGEDF